MPIKILLIEDESGIADNIIYSMQSEGFPVEWKKLGRDGLDFLMHNPCSLVILDIGLPDTSGFEICREIRKQSDTPIIFLTARGDEIDRVVGLELGADDYVVKPFSPRELVARVKAILRRTEKKPFSSQQSFNLDEHKRQVLYQGNRLELTSYEYGILCLLIKKPGQVFTREQLMQAVWPTPEESYDRAVDTHIKTLRAKLRRINADDDSLLTHRGIGYSLNIQI